MKIKEVDNCPKGLRYFEDDDLESKLEPKDLITGTIQQLIIDSVNYMN